MGCQIRAQDTQSAHNSSYYFERKEEKKGTPQKKDKYLSLSMICSPFPPIITPLTHVKPTQIQSVPHPHPHKYKVYTFIAFAPQSPMTCFVPVTIPL